MSEIILGSYQFTIEYKGAKVVSPQLEVFDGIRLFPLRAGIYQKKEEENKETNAYPVANFTSLDGRHGHIQFKPYGYYINPMTLRNGWLYIYDYTTQSVYVYECFNAYYTLEEIIKMDSANNTKEALERFIGTKRSYIPLSSNNTVNVFYTSIKLSATFIAEKYKVKALGHEFKAKDWIDLKTSSDINKRHVDAKWAWIMFDSLMAQEEVAHSIFKEYKNTIDSVTEQNAGSHTKYRDVFFVVDDPLGCLEKMIYCLNQARIDHEALLRSLRTGVDPQIIRELLHQKGQQAHLITDIDLFDHYSEVQKKQIEQAQYIFALTTYVYNLIYSDNKNHLKKGERALDLKFIEKLLGVKERQESRGKIENLRKMVVAYINSPVFENHCELFSIETQDIASTDAQEEHAAMKLMVQNQVSTLLQAVAPVPHSNDMGIDLPQIYKKYQDPCEDTIKQIFNSMTGAGDHKVGNLLQDIPTLAGLDMSIESKDTFKDLSLSKYLLLCDTLINTYWRIALEGRKTKLLIDKFRVDDIQKLFVIDKADAENYLQSIGRRRYQTLNHNIGGAGKWTMNVNSAKELKKPPTINTIAANPGKSHKILKQVAQSKAYMSIVSFLSVTSVFDILENDKDARKVAFQSVEFASTVAAMQRRFVESSLELRQASTFGSTNKLATIAKVQSQIRVLGAVGMIVGGINAGIDFYKSIFNENDIDAGLFYLASGAALLGAGGIALFFAATAWAGPAGMILAVLSVACAFFAEWFKDTDIEKFLKRTALCEKLPKNYTSPPYKLMERTAMELHRKKPLKDIEPYQQALIDYKYQLEEFLYTQAMLPFFNANVQFIQKEMFLDPSTNTLVLYDQIRLTVESSFAQAGINLSEIETYCISRKLWNDEGILLSASKVTEGERYRNYGTDYVSKGHYLYTFDDYNPNRAFYSGNNNLYIIMFLRFKHNDNSVTPMPRPNVDKKLYLAYRYKIDIPSEGFGKRKVYLYNKAQTILEQVQICPKQEAFYF